MEKCKILSIKSVGIQKTYNLTMKSCQHNYKITDGANSVYSMNSHAAAYAYLAYQTAWLKRKFKKEFMCALLSSVMSEQQKEKRDRYEASLPKMGIELLPYDINLSKEVYTIEGGNIRKAISTMKGVGEIAIKEIVGGQPYKSIEDFVSRNSGHSINKNVFESLVNSGGLKCWGDKSKLFEMFVSAKDRVAIQKKKERKHKEFDGGIFD